MLARNCVEPTKTGLKRTGLKLLDDFFEGMRLDQIDTDVLHSYRKKRVDTMCLEDEKRVIRGEKADDMAKRLQKKREQHERTVNRDLALLRRKDDPHSSGEKTTIHDAALPNDK